ncbi:MAG: AI-2E family transporter [Gemmatimonadota bacterium]|nr:AI-2E family transporter [Gemmatimonadota bacterium]
MMHEAVTQPPRDPPPDRPPSPGLGPLGPLLFAACLVVVIFGMQQAQGVLVPMLLAAFLAVLGIRPLEWLRERGVPHVLGVAMVSLGLVLVALLLFTSVGASINEFTEQIPFYQRRLEEALVAVFSRYGERFPTTTNEILEMLQPGGVMRLTASLLTSLGTLFTNATLILFTVVFILLEAHTFGPKLMAVSGRSDLSFESFARFTSGVQRYLYLKTLISLLTGALVAAWVAAMGLDFPLLWGLLAFLLNYVPTIGSIIAAVPAVLLAFIQLGLGRALVIGGGYLVINQLVGNLLDPRVMGRGLGLSTLVVFLSLIFWGWVLGPVGMLLSVPLTMTLKIALESNERTRWAATLLAEGAPDRYGDESVEGSDDPAG